MKINNVALALGLTSAITIMGCDGGSSSTTPPPTTLYSVKAIDGYLRNAKVWLDTNPNFIHDEDEPSALTGEGGVAELDVSNIENYETYQLVALAIAGQAIDEDSINNPLPDGEVMPISMVLSAPAGETNITPLSSFVNVLMQQNPTALNDPEQSAQLKQQAVNEAAHQLGLSPEAVLGDYLETGNTNPAAAFAAKSIVESERVLPKTPEEMASLAEKVQETGENAEAKVTELKIAESVNKQIKQVIETTDEQNLVNTPFPVKPPQENAPSADDDSDGVPNDLDEFPHDAQEWVDSDGDGIGNNHDLHPFDRDNDGYNDELDAFDDDPAEWLDSDNDGIGDNADPDDDNDGISDDIDEFPLDSSKAGDPDQDGIDTIKDLYPFDHDNDGYDDEIDAFDDDPTEWADSDADGMGDNADLDDDNDGVNDELDGYPFDNTQAGDPDNDGVDTLVDAYPHDASKSVADQIRQNSDLMPVLNLNHRDVLILNVNAEQVVETLNSGEFITTLTYRYVSQHGVEYGYKQSIDIQNGSDFTRIETYEFDFNLDGVAQFIGHTLDIGTRTADSEHFWRYVDESDATPESGVNGSARIFDNLDFSARTHPTELFGVDTIQHFDVTFTQGSVQQNARTTMTQFDVAGFDHQDSSTHVANYASMNNTSQIDLLDVLVIDRQDWHADGSINTTLALGVGIDGAYAILEEGPVWANPQDGLHQEYADFNYTAENWDNLTNYWYEYQVEYQSDGSVLEQGQRFVLDSLSNSKLTDDNNPNGLMFHEWDMLTNTVSENEKNEFVTWTHYALNDYDFTAAQDNPGQAYRIYTQQFDGIWTTLSFDEWGSTDVIDLAAQIENARSAGTSMYDIDANIVPGLDRYAASLPNDTFQYHKDGTPRRWYAVTQDPRLTDGTPTVVPITLSDGGILPNSHVVSNGPDLILVAPKDEQHITPWFGDYYRQRIDMYGLNMDPAHFSWSSNIGQLFINQADAETRHIEVINPTYRVCSKHNTGIKVGATDDYWTFLSAASQCGYIGIDASYLEGLTLYYQEDAQNIFSYQFNANGSGSYVESNELGDNLYHDNFSWQLTEHGIIRINNGGEIEHFAYIADENGRYSLLGLFEWNESGQAYSEIFGLEMTQYQPIGYRVCTEGDTQWDPVTNQPASSPSYRDFQQAVSTCGGAMPFAAERLNGLEWHEYDPESGEHRIMTFYPDGRVFKSKNGVESGPFLWEIDTNGYLKIIYDQKQADDFIIFALIATQEDKFSLKVFNSYPEQVNGQTEIWREILSTEFVSTNPVDKVGVISALTTHVNWYSPWSEWNDLAQTEQLYFDHLDVTQNDRLTWTGSSIVEVNKTLSAIDISDEFDIMLTAEGWKKVTGFEFDLRENNIVGVSPSAPSLTYSIIYASQQNKEGQIIANETPDVFVSYYDETAVYPSGSEAIAITMRNDLDSYFLHDWQPYHMRAEAGVANDSNIIHSLDELFVTGSAGDNTEGDLLDATSIGHEVSVELVRRAPGELTGTANFYYTDWNINQASKLASGSWALRSLNGEQLVLFEIPQTVIDRFGNVIDTAWMFYSVHRSQTGGNDLVHVGEFWAAKSERDDVYLMNTIAKDALINAADIQ